MRAFVSQSSELAPIETVQLEERNIQRFFRTSGRVAPAVLTEVKSEVSGRVAQVLVRAGDTVNRDDVLLKLDQSELESELREAERMIESARLRAERAKLDVERKRKLHAEKLVPDQQFDEAEIDAALAENELAVARARADTIQQKLAKTTIYAPHNGVILNLAAREGTVISGATSVSEGTKLMEVAELNSLQVEAKVNEVDVGGLEVGMSANLEFDSLPEVKLQGKVLAISPSAVPDADDKNRLVFPLTVGFSAGEHPVRPGITARITILLEEVKQALVLPVPVVFTEKGETFVFAKSGSKWSRQPVKTGIADGQYVQILEGVQKDDHVARTQPPEAAVKSDS